MTGFHGFGATAALRERAGPNVAFLGMVDDATMAERFARCRALVFPGVELTWNAATCGPHRDNPRMIRLMVGLGNPGPEYEGTRQQRPVAPHGRVPTGRQGSRRCGGRNAGVVINGIHDARVAVLRADILDLMRCIGRAAQRAAPAE